ncbi:basic proline-rich protein-like [Vidua chalybeata]|uniref:basic proline-rich protein-like n=1 Tax=Vidua chalybeata TaxID=81927 RepID=UPI0023A79978|nr:basic proline-rich protein-like [Vidua chalybeata]
MAHPQIVCDGADAVGSEPRRAARGRPGQRDKGPAERCRRRGPGGLCSPAARGGGAGAGAAPPPPPGPAAPPAPTNRPPTAPRPPGIANRSSAQSTRRQRPAPPRGPSRLLRPGAAHPGCCLGSRWQCGQPVCLPGSRSTPYFINIAFSSIPAARFLPGHTPRLAPAPESCPLLPPGPWCRHRRPSASCACCGYRIPRCPWATPEPPGASGLPMPAGTHCAGVAERGTGPARNGSRTARAAAGPSHGGTGARERQPRGP